MPPSASGPSPLSHRTAPGAILQWLTVRRGEAPLILCMPHAGIELPPEYSPSFTSLWLARKDTDWWVDRLYDFSTELDATIVRTAISRSIIDVNRDPTGKSLYPGQATTELCPTTTFDGESLYETGSAPDEQEIDRRRVRFFEPYHQAVAGEIARLRQHHPRVVLYDCHSIRSRISRLFADLLPHINLGTYDGLACSPELTSRLEAVCDSSGLSRVTNGRFKGGYTIRRYGRPAEGVHALQMELACRSYMPEPEPSITADNWPTDYDERASASVRQTLRGVLQACVRFAADEK